MKRLLVIGATVVALSATSVVAWAGTGPVADIASHVATQTEGQDIDPVVMKVLDRIQSMWQWQGDEAGHQVAERAHEVADPIRDAAREHDVDAIHDAADQVRDRAHDVADPARDAVHDQEMARDHDIAQGQNAAEGHLSDQGFDHGEDLAHGQSMDRSVSQDHMGGQGRMDR